MIKLPNHKAALYISHNSHINSYQTINEYIDFVDPNWQNEEHKQRSINTNEIWEMRIYENSPVGSIHIAAPTLDELLVFANS